MKIFAGRDEIIPSRFMAGLCCYELLILVTQVKKEMRGKMCKGGEDAGGEGKAKERWEEQ